MKGALDVHRTLLAQDVPHEIVRLPRVVLHADEIPEVLGLPNDRCVAVRMYEADSGLVAVAVRAGDTPHPAALLAATGSRHLRPAAADVVNHATDYAASLVSPVLLPDDVQLLADACIGHVDVVYVPTGDGGTVLGIASHDLLVTTGARVAEVCVPDVPTYGTVDLTTEDIDVADTLGLSGRDWR